jgi:hypothetical protein
MSGGGQSGPWFEDFLKASAPWYGEFAQANAAAATPAPPKPASTPLPDGRPNRRAHDRFAVDEADAWLHVGAVARLLKLARSAVQGRVADLSVGGAMVLTGTKLEVGARCRIRILFEKFRDVIESGGEVRWSRQVPRKDSAFVAGVHFVRLAPPLGRKIALMREYFTSMQYREIRELRRREEERGFKFPS